MSNEVFELTTMRRLRKSLLWGGLLGVAGAVAVFIWLRVTAPMPQVVGGITDSPPEAGSVNYATGEDARVLDALLLHLLKDPELKRNLRKESGRTFLLHSRTPEKTGMLDPDQINSELRGGGLLPDRRLPLECEENLRVRNCMPGTFDGVEANYADLAFSEAVEVVDLSGSLDSLNFEKNFAHGKAWMEAYLPGYSKNGLLAVVRGWVGPSPHGAMVTAVLEKSDGSWVVKWHRVRFFL